MLLAILATPTYGGGERKVCVYFFVFKYLNICVIVCSESDHLNKKRFILTAASKHFGHVMFYAADVESGLIR